MTTDTRPGIDVVVPAFDEERHIGQCLDRIFAQDHPPDLFRVVVVDAGSTDRTADVVRARDEFGTRLTLVEGLGRLNAGQALNAGIAVGDAELIARVDAHTYLEPDYLSRAAEIMSEADSSVACVGGQPIQVGETRFGEAVVLARRSHFGVGDSVYADRRERASVETVQGGVYRRKALAGIGGFATAMLVSEDEECSFRLREAGHEILLDTRLRFRYTTRGSWTALYRQHRNYGRSRVRVVATHPSSLRLRHLVPAVFVLALGALLAAGIGSRRARRLLALVAGTYGAAATGAAVAASAGTDPALAPRVAAAFAAQHLGYGIGVLGGLASLAGARLGLSEPDAAVRRR